MIFNFSGRPSLKSLAGLTRRNSYEIEPCLPAVIVIPRFGRGFLLRIICEGQSAMNCGQGIFRKLTKNLPPESQEYLPTSFGVSLCFSDMVANQVIGHP